MYRMDSFGANNKLQHGNNNNNNDNITYIINLNQILKYNCNIH